MARHDQTITQARVDELNTVKRWIKPIFTYEQPGTEYRQHLLSKEDFNAIRDGYACGDCLAFFGMVRMQCPVCHKPMALEPAPMREEWDTKLKERAGKLPDAPVARNPFTSIDDVIADIRRDPDIEHWNL